MCTTYMSQSVRARQRVGACSGSLINLQDLRPSSSKLASSLPSGRPILLAFLSAGASGTFGLNSRGGRHGRVVGALVCFTIGPCLCSVPFLWVRMGILQGRHMSN